MKIEVYRTRFSDEVRFVGPDMGTGEIGGIVCTERYPYVTLSASGFTRTGVMEGGAEFWHDAERVTGWRLQNAYEAAGGRAAVEKMIRNIS